MSTDQCQFRSVGLHSGQYKQQLATLAPDSPDRRPTPLSPPCSYGTKTCSNLRLWDALPLVELDLDAFNAGQYEKVRVDEFLRRVASCSIAQKLGCATLAACMG